MLMGVSCNDFWFGDYTMLKFYARAYELSLQRASDNMWLAGAYNFNAFSTSLSNIHFDGKSHKTNTYMASPVRVAPLSKAEKEIKAEQERQKVIAYFDRLGKKWKKEL